MIVSLTWEEFVEWFKPIPNHIAADAPLDGFMFETYGAEIEHVKAQDPTHVWTFVDGDETQGITNGWHYVNRMGYLITRVPFNPDDFYHVSPD